MPSTIVKGAHHQLHGDALSHRVSRVCQPGVDKSKPAADRAAPRSEPAVIKLSSMTILSRGEFVVDQVRPTVTSEPSDATCLLNGGLYSRCWNAR
jgi:hypothetical protein